MFPSDVVFLDQFRNLAESNVAWNRNLRSALNECEPNDEPLTSRLYLRLFHVLVADQLWLCRLEGGNPPLTGLDSEKTVISPEQFWFERTSVDDRIKGTVSNYRTSDLLRIVCYQAFDGHARRDVLGICLSRMFNHQGHHQSRIQRCVHYKNILVEDDGDCWHFF